MRTGRPTEKTKAKVAAPKPEAGSLSAPKDLPRELRDTWKHVVSDLSAIGTVSNTDICRLAGAFRQLGNSLAFQAMLDAAFDDPDATPSDKAKYQSAISSATAAYSRIIGDLETQIAKRPTKEAPKKGTDIEDFRP